MSALPQVAHLHVVEGAEIVFDVEEGKPRVPDGVYFAVCAGGNTQITFNAMKVYLRFRITEGDHEGKELFAAYTVGGKIIPGRGPGSGPRLKLTRRMGLFKMLCRVLHLPINTKAHRVGTRELVGKLCQVRTRTVEKDYKQRDLPDALKYSIVADVLNVEAG